MKTYLFLIFLCGVWLTNYAQAPCIQRHKGEVLLRSVEGKKAAGIVIIIDGNTGPDTDPNGVFQWNLTKCPGMNVTLNIKNENYRIT